MEQSKYPHLSDKEVMSLARESVLFLGPGIHVAIPELLVLDPYHYKVLCVDLEPRPSKVKPVVKWLQEDIRGLDFELLKNDYDTVVIQRLCDKKSLASFTLELIKDCSLIGFENIVIEFCDDMNHYKAFSCDEAGMRLNASLCKYELKACDYNTRVLFHRNDKLHIKLLASKNMPVTTNYDERPILSDLGFPHWDNW